MPQPSPAAPPSPSTPRSASRSRRRNGQPQADLERKLKDQGWKISRVKITNGCYEVYGKDAKNNPVETFFHPKTLEVVTAPK